MVKKLEELKWDADIVTCVPMHKVDKRKRGYNQSQIIAEIIADRVGIKFDETLQKTKQTPHQAGLDRGKRMTNLRGAIEARGRTEIEGKKIILIDDVYTTGSTADVCAEALYSAGAANVKVVTFASGKIR
jgi:ComF family protein